MCVPGGMIWNIGLWSSYELQCAHAFSVLVGNFHFLYHVLLVDLSQLRFPFELAVAVPFIELPELVLQNRFIQVTLIAIDFGHSR